MCNRSLMTKRLASPMYFALLFTTGWVGGAGSGASAESSHQSPMPVAAAVDVDGVWCELGSPCRTGHTSIYDPKRDRLVLFGGYDPETDEVWTLELSTNNWKRLDTWGESPGPRDRHSAIYDPIRDRMLVFGGVYGEHGDVWALSLAGIPIWTRLPVAGDPSLRFDHSAIYDPVRDRMLVYGGGAGLNDDVWQLSLGEHPMWSVVTTSGTRPPPRSGHSAVYDERRDRMIVFGGDNGTLNDTWELSLADPPTWTRLDPATAPLGLWGNSAVYDAARDRMLLIGSGIFALSLASPLAWTPIFPVGEAVFPPYGHASAYDSRRDRVLLTGGNADGSSQPNVYVLQLEPEPIWSHIATSGPPGPLYGHTATLDPVSKRIIVFGGLGADWSAATWSVSLADPLDWRPLGALGQPPSARAYHTAVYDAARDRILVFGGMSAQSFGSSDVWALYLRPAVVWIPLAVDGTPPTPRLWHSAIYDPWRDRMIVFGGMANGQGSTSETWELTLAGRPQWHLLPQGAVAPTPRSSHAAILDPVRGRMLVFGGEPWPESYLDDTWAFDLATDTWSPADPAGGRPSARGGHSAVYDAVGDRMIVFGGQDFWESSATNDSWELTLGAGGGWRRLQPTGSFAAPRRNHAVVYDPDRRRMIVLQGYAAYGESRSDVAILSWPDPTAANQALPTAFGLLPNAPNPFNPSTLLRFDLSAAAPVRLVIYDVAGRQVRELLDAVRGAGRHEVRWDGRDDRGVSLASGTYTCQLQAGSVRATRKLTLLR